MANTSLRYDREVKLPKYAAVGIAELWIVDLTANRVEVHREPSGDRYGRIRAHGRDGAITPAAFPHVPLQLDAVLP